MPGSWAELQLVLHQLGLIFDGLRDDLVRLDGVVLAALPLVVSLRKLVSAIRSGLKAPKRKRSKAKRQKRSRRNQARR